MLCSCIVKYCSKVGLHTSFKVIKCKNKNYKDMNTNFSI